MRTMRVSLRALVSLAALTVPTVLWAAEWWVGTWKLNPGKSQSSSSLPRKQVFTFEAQGEWMKTTEDIINAKGLEYQVTFRARFDGKDYPVTGSRAGTELVSLRRIDSNTLEVVTKKKDGVASGTHRLVVSADGKVMTVTAWRGASASGEPTSVRIYEKQ